MFFISKVNTVICEKKEPKTVVDVLILKKAPTVFEEIIYRAVLKRIKGCILLPYGRIN